MRWASFKDLRSGLAAAIRKRRETLDYSQEHVAHEAGLSVRHYAKIESGAGNPTLQTLHDIALSLDIDVLTLLKVASRRKPS